MDFFAALFYKRFFIPTTDKKLVEIEIKVNICWFRLWAPCVTVGNGPHVLGNEPYLSTQFMHRVILIMGRLGWVVCLSWP